MNATECVTNYLKEMLEWENNRNKQLKSKEYKANENDCQETQDQQSRSSLERIVNKYLTEKSAKTLGASALITMATGSPPIYDQSIESAEESTNFAKIICKSNNGSLLGSVIRYTLAKQDGAWKINEIHSSRDKSNWRKSNSI